MSFLPKLPTPKKGQSGPGETALERETATIGTQWAQLHDTVFKPAEATLRDRVTNTADDKQRVLAQSRADTAVEYSKAIPQVTQSQTTAGARPGSGRFNGALSDINMDEGRTAGIGGNDVAAAFEDEAMQGRGAVVNYGLGKASDGVSGIGRAAEVSRRNAIADAQASAASHAATGQLVGSLAAVGANYALDGLAAPQTADYAIGGKYGVNVQGDGTGAVTYGR